MLLSLQLSLPATRYSGGASGIPTAGLVGAWSIGRSLVGGYSGPLLNVRRGSDSAASDIGQAGGLLDQSALTTFTGANFGYATKAYSQYGANYLEQPTAGRQPDLVQAGTVVLANGEPAVACGSSDSLCRADGCGLTTNQPMTLLVVARLNASTVRTTLGGVLSSTNGGIVLENKTYLSTPNNWGVYIAGSSFRTNIASETTGLHVIALRVTAATVGANIASNVTLTVDGVTATLTSTSGTGNFTALNFNKTVVGSDVSWFGTGAVWMSEALLWDEDIGETALAAVIADIKTHYSIP